MKKTKQKWCLRILIWLVAVLVLLGVRTPAVCRKTPTAHWCRAVCRN